LRIALLDKNPLSGVTSSFKLPVSVEPPGCRAIDSMRATDIPRVRPRVRSMRARNIVFAALQSRQQRRVRHIADHGHDVADAEFCDLAHHSCGFLRAGEVAMEFNSACFICAKARSKNRCPSLAHARAQRCAVRRAGARERAGVRNLDAQVHDVQREAACGPTICCNSRNCVRDHAREFRSRIFSRVRLS